MGWLEDETGLERCAANFVPLTPLSHLIRACEVFPEREALVYDNWRITYRQYHERVTRLASALNGLGIKPGEVVSTIVPNIPAAIESHFGVPACGAVINAINIRLDVDTIAYILEHARARALIVDSRFIPMAEDACRALESPPRIIEVADEQAGYPASGNYQEYEELLSSGSPTWPWAMPTDEWESISLNYTSGTTGRPKGVVSHHRGAYLMTMGTVISWRLTLYPRYLAIVPLFHCNGWNHSWMIPVLGGTVVCCREITATAIYSAISDEGITHFGGAPIVLNMIANATDDERREFDQVVEVFTAGAPPAAATLQRVEALNFNVTQVYGLTETFGHVTECVWKDDLWKDLQDDERATMKARTGVPFPMMDRIAVVDRKTGEPVPRDGGTLGEIVMRGNAIMKGYYRNPQATAESFENGYFWTGDIALQHEDGYIKIADRSKDIIISGGENVSSVEVEGILMRHPAVSLCSVVARPDEKWGETPFAFVELKEGASCTAEDLIAHCRRHLAGFKSPKGVAFRTLPKTATGKIQKFVLRDIVRNL